MKKILIMSLLALTSTTLHAATKEIVVLATGDLHSRIYPYEYAIDESLDNAGIAKIATLIHQEREASTTDNLLLVDLGDTVQDNSGELFNEEAVHPMVKAMNMLDYDFWAIGNHEFDFDLHFLGRNIAAFEGKALASNVTKTDTGEHFVTPYEIVEMDGVKVAILGFVAPHIPLWHSSTPEKFENLTFERAETSIQQSLKELEGKYDVLVGAFHLSRVGENGDWGTEEIAKKFKEFDVIFGAHDHAEYSENIDGVHIAAAGPYGANLMKASIKVDVSETGEATVSSLNIAHIPTDGVTPDPAILKAFKTVHETSIADANEVVGMITEDFITGVDYITGEDAVTTMPRAQLEDTAVVSFLNEVQLHYADADLSGSALFTNDSNLKKGEFKKKDVAFIYKYTNTLVGLNITGENFIKYLEWSANYYKTSKPGDITISFNEDVRGYNYDMVSGENFHYQIDVSQPAGKRITSVMFNDKPLELEKVYKLAVNNYRHGQLLDLGLVTAEDIYYDSFAELGDAGRIRDLIINYIETEREGKVTPFIYSSWEIIGFDFNHPDKEKAFNLIKEGEITIERSADGRTLNTKSITSQDIK